MVVVVDRRMTYITPATTYINDEKDAPPAAGGREIFGVFCGRKRIPDVAKSHKTHSVSPNFRACGATKPPLPSTTQVWTEICHRKSSSTEGAWDSRKIPRIAAASDTKFHLLSEQLNGTFHLLSNGIPDYRRCMTVTQAETKGNLS